MSNSSLRLALAGSFLLAIGLALVPVIQSQGPPDGGESPDRPAARPVRGERGLTGSIEKGEASVPLAAPEISPDLREKLDTLRQSHRQDRPSMARIRLEGALDRLWREGAPLSLLVHEAADEEAPLSYRLHMARRLGNAAKTSGAGDRDYLSSSLRAIVDRLETSPEARVALAAVLVTMDESAKTVRSVAKVAEDVSGDEMRAAAIAALCQVGAHGAADEVWGLAQELVSEPARNPLALGTAIPPLARQPEVPVETLLQPIVAATTDYPLLIIALQAVALRAPAPETAGILVTAWQRAGEFPPREEARVRSACRHILGRLAPRLHADPTLMPANTAEQLEAIFDDTEAIQ